MQLEKHSLLNDLPEHHHTIRHLKMNDSHFARLFDQYHELENEVHTIEEQDSAVSDQYIEALKQKRLQLKDELYLMVMKTEKAL